MLLLRAPIEKVELEPHKPERAEKRGRDGERRAKETRICYSWDMHWENAKEKG